MGLERVTTVDGVSIHVSDLRAGCGDRLLMLHGVGRAGRTFSSLACLLPSRFDVRAIDFRGHGRSGHADGQYRICDYLQDALAAIDAESGSVVLYGHSLGALVATAAAAARPARVSAVVLEDPPSPSFWQNLSETMYLPTFAAMQRWAGRRDLSVRELTANFGNEVVKSWPDGRVMRISDVRDAVSLRFSASCLRDLDPRVMTRILEGRWHEGFDQQASFAKVPCPALLLRGDVARGGMLSLEDAVQLQGQMPDCLRIDFPTAGHLLHWQVRSEVAGHVGTFLESL
ncbi:MAG: alpha/beta fold hydrolase [Planctomycetota bacterium]